jgi:hypothetical protein
MLEGSSSAEREMESSDPAHLRILDKFSIDNPSVKGRSHLKLENPDSCKKNETKATCDESMAYIDIPVLFASILTYLTKSFKESIIFLKT